MKARAFAACGLALLLACAHIRAAAALPVEALKPAFKAANGIEQVGVVGFSSFTVSVLSTGACAKFTDPRAGVACGVGVAFVQFAWNNRYNIMYYLQWNMQLQRMAMPTTTPCRILDGKKYYCY